MPIDRAATLRNAEKFLRQGKLEPAIAEYLRIVSEQPRDWNTANIVGDLYVRAGRVEQAVDQFVAIADTLGTEGFLPKAAAIYKKVLKLRPEHEHALLRCAEIAASQGVLVDARTFLRAVADRRRSTGDARGVAEIVARLGTLDPSDHPARLRGARARVELDDLDGALGEFEEVATQLIEQDRPAEAADALCEATELVPDAQKALRERLLVRIVQAGQTDRARQCARSSGELQSIASELERSGLDADAFEVLRQALELDPDDERLRARLAEHPLTPTAVAPTAVEPPPDEINAPDDAPFDEPSEAATFEPAAETHEADTPWFQIEAVAEECPPAAREADDPWPAAERLFVEGRPDEGRLLLEEALEQNPARRQDVALLGLRLCQVDPDTAFRLVDRSADAAIAAGDWESAAAALQELVVRVPSHLAALMRLVEISVDGGLGATLYSAQGQLTDAYLEAGMAEEARFIAEDLVAREPWERVHLERFRRALTMLGEADPEGVIARRLSGETPFISTDATVSATAYGDFGDVAPAAAPCLTPRAEGPDEVPVDFDVTAHFHEHLVLDDERDGATVEVVSAEDDFDVVGALPAPPMLLEADGEDGEVDLSGALEDLQPADAVVMEPSTKAAARLELEKVMAQLRDDPDRREELTAAEQDFQKGLELLTAGAVDEGIDLLTRASSSPQLRFATGALLARVHRDLGLTAHALVWFEQASQAPPPSAEEGQALLYDFADLLESTGSRARALDTFIELQAEAPGYRDVSRRVADLLPAAARG